MVINNIDLNSKVVLVTGAAGFIGANLVKRLLAEFEGVKVVGIDSITDYYDVRLKYERLEQLAQAGDRFVFVKQSIADRAAVDSIFAEYHPQVVVNIIISARLEDIIKSDDIALDICIRICD